MTRGGAAKLRGAARNAVELFAWWRTELRDLTQWLMRQLPNRKTPEVLLRVEGDRVSVERRDGASWTTVLVVDAAKAATLPAELQGARAAIALGSTVFFFDELQLPAAVERHLGPALRLQLERRLPVPLAGLLYDHETLPVDKKLGLLRVRVAVAHRERVEKLCELALALGLVPVSASALMPDGAQRFDLMRRRRDPIRWNVSPLDLRLAKIAGAGALVLLAVVGAQWGIERAQVREQVEELRAQADKLRATRNQLENEARPLRALQAVARMPAAPDLLATLSSAVPAPNWFSHVVLSTPLDGVATLQLTGQVPSKEQVVEALRAVPGMRDVETSSAYGGEILGSERIELSARYVLPTAEGVAP
jgi:hypothetical protein